MSPTKCKEAKRRRFECYHKLLPTKVSQPLTLSKELDKEVQAYLLNLHAVGGVVSGAKARASVTGIIKIKNNKPLASS